MWRGTAALHRAQRSLAAQPARSVRESRQPAAEWSSSPQCTACGSRPTGRPTRMAPTDGSTETGANGRVDVPSDRLCDRPSRRATAVDGASLAHAAPGSLSSCCRFRWRAGGRCVGAAASTGRLTSTGRIFKSRQDGCFGDEIGARFRLRLRAVRRHRVLYADRSTVHVCLSSPRSLTDLFYY